MSRKRNDLVKLTEVCDAEEKKLQENLLNIESRRRNVKWTLTWCHDQGDESWSSLMRCEAEKIC